MPIHLTSQELTHAEAFRLCETLQNFELTFKDLKFSGEGPIIICNFLTRLVDEADALDISEVQLIVLLPHLLLVVSSDQYRAATNGSQSGMACGIVN